MTRFPRPARRLAAPAAAVVAIFAAAALGLAPASSQNPDVELNVRPGLMKKINIAVPDFTLVSGTDPQNWAKRLPEITAADLAFTSLFSVVSGTPTLPQGGADALKPRLQEFAANGALQALQGLLAVRGDRFEVEMRLYDLTSPEFNLIGSKKLVAHVSEPRRAAHKIADEVVLLVTGERGVADTKMAFASTRSGVKELYLMDYDGAGAAPMTANKSINMSPTWSPDSRSLAFTSYMNGYPFLYRIFPFERRPVHLLAGYAGINSSPAWSPDGHTVALTLSKDGNPEIYLLTVTTGDFRRLTTHAAIDTEPTWSPTGRELAFVSDRSGPAQIFVMDAEGTNVRRVTSKGFNTQPRWSPKGDTIAFTSRQGNHDIWAVGPDGSNLRRLTAGSGDNESASWSPNGRHLVFQSSRLGGTQLVTMLADGSEPQVLTGGPGQASSPAWSPRLP
ncbi:MAG: Tol-Pal system beta propeller repeat protein TolB [Candidatus Rokubacteria bacterium]|nr:Tol-Pal system beta propeller repeat protein TolB [Candidatus Rokubacteria bacterium]